MADNKVLDQVFLPAFVGSYLLFEDSSDMEPTRKEFRENLGVFTRETFFMPILINKIKVQVFLFHRDLKSVSENNPREAYGLFDVLKTFYNRIDETMSIEVLNTEIKILLSFCIKIKKDLLQTFLKKIEGIKNQRFFRRFFLLEKVIN